jgi:tetratricopeptide (TPR) repeat protein
MRVFQQLMCWLSSTLIVYGLVYSSAAAAVVELEFAQGVVAFSQGQLPEAEAHFQQLLAEQPQNPQATYYLGQVQLGLGKLAEAIDSFRKAIGLSPANAAVHLDLALALIKAEQIPQALEELSQVSTQLSDRASLHYYMGYCNYRLGNMQNALPPLQKAQQLDQGFAAAAGYYLGLVHYRLGQTEQATQQFSELSHKDSAGYSALARQNLAILEQGAIARAEKRYFLYAQVGGGYDSYVTLDTEVTLHTPRGHEGSPKLFLALGGSYLPMVRTKDAIELSANFYRSFYFTTKTEGFDLTNAALAARYRRQIASQLQLEVGYLFDLDCLDGSRALGLLLDMDSFGIFMHGHTLNARLRISEGRAFETSIEYRFSARFFNLNPRDNFGHELVAKQDFFLADGRVKLSATAGMVFEDARRRDYDLWGPLLATDVTWRITNTLNLQAAFGWQRQDHFRFSDISPGKERVDNQLAGALVFGWDFDDNLGLRAEYQYVNNRSSYVDDEFSDRPYQYERHIVSLSVIGVL